MIHSTNPNITTKTVVQNTDGLSFDAPMSALETASDLYQTGGLGVFFDGITPKMLRAGVCNSVNFYLYDIMMQHLTAQ